MKRVLLTLALIAITGSSMAQEAADKKYQAGLVTGFGTNFQSMETKKIVANGIGTDFTIGANVNISLTETIGFTTGAEFDFETLKYKAADGENIYYHYVDSEILKSEDVAGNANAELFRLDTRKQKATYLSIPTMMLFRTNFIGYFRYFGKFGLRNSFLLSNKIFDTGENFTPDLILGGIPTAGDNDNMTASNEMFFFKSTVGAAGGAEWNFTGSTSLVAELGFYYGFTPLYYNRDAEKTFLYTSGFNNGSGNDLNFSNQAKQTQLMLKVSILF